MNTQQALNIGDKVIFVNNNGVEFPNKTITGIEVIDGETKYYYSPSEAPWFANPAKNFRKEFNNPNKEITTEEKLIDEIIRLRRKIINGRYI